MTNNTSIQEVLFFPQMRPEKTDAPKAVVVELTENEKLVMDILSKEGRMDLNALKEAAGLSNKQWDKSLKGLREKELITISKTDDGLFVEKV